jgi:hypothetical protein
MPSFYCPDHASEKNKLWLGDACPSPILDGCKNKGHVDALRELVDGMCQMCRHDPSAALLNNIQFFIDVKIFQFIIANWREAVFV